MHFPEISVINWRLGQRLESLRDLMSFLCAQGQQSLGCGTVQKEKQCTRGSKLQTALILYIPRSAQSYSLRPGRK